jgi:hypothetical protein
MKNKIIPLAATYLIVILFVICVLVVITEDRDAPKILFGDEEIEYVEGEDTKVLLSNVSAVDEEEGDVTFTIAIESIRVLSSGRKASVIYVARDSKNNIVKVSRIIKYQILEENVIPEEISEVIDATTEVKAEIINPDGSIQNPEDQEVEQIEPIDVIQEEETVQGPLISTGDPIIKLNTHSVTITAGDYFNIMNYVEEAVDDEDDVWRRILIKGDYSSKIPGEYSIRFSITDRDGNRSNVETLTLIVE